MAYIRYVPEAELDPAERVPDPDNIVQIHAVNPAVMRRHYDLYVDLMRRPGPIPRIQREIVAVAVSAENGCHY
jgi:alkylhydroperoxidase family enzyme